MYEELDTYNENSFDLLVSVIITTFNRKHLVARAIESVLAQTYKNIEIIVVDDCSTDGTVELIKNYNDKVKYIRNKNNVGLSASRNVGIRASSGEYLSFLDDDDELLPAKIAKQMAFFFEKENVGVVYCGCERRNKEVAIEWNAKLRGNIYPAVLSCTPNAIHTMILHRSCFDSVGFFDESLIGFEDYDFWVRLARVYTFDYVDEVLAVYHIHGSQLTSNIIERIESIEQMLSKYEEEMLENREVYSNYLRKLASRYALLGDGYKFKKNIFHSIRQNFKNYGSYLHVVLFFVSKTLHKKVIQRYGLLTVGDVTLS